MDKTYAVIKDGFISNVIVAPADFAASGLTLVDITDSDPQPGIGWSYDGETFTAPAPEPRLDITLSKTTAAPNEEITASVAIRQGETLVDRTFTSYVPIFDIDGSKNQLLIVEFAGGQGQVTFSFATPGIYTLDVNKIRPAPESILPAPPEIIIA